MLYPMPCLMARSSSTAAKSARIDIVQNVSLLAPQRDLAVSSVSSYLVLRRRGPLIHPFSNIGAISISVPSALCSSQLSQIMARSKVYNISTLICI
jgi:hypothetical protein